MTLSSHKRHFYVDPGSIQDKFILINQPEYHHIIDVLRYKEGNQIVFCDGLGNEYRGEIDNINRQVKELRVYIKDIIKHNQGNTALILVQGIVKGNKMDFIIEKAAELGVTDIYPIYSERSAVKPDNKKESIKYDKWKRLLRESFKQSRAIKIPVLKTFKDFEKVATELKDIDLKIICYVDDIGDNDLKLRDIINSGHHTVAVAIGPEGGFTKKELDMAVRSGWYKYFLKGPIMRSETAAMVMLGIIKYELGNLGTSKN